MSRNSRLVLVDDSAEDAEFVRRALAIARPGTEVVVIRNATEALDQLVGRGEAADVDMILLDLKLRGVDGHTVLRAVRLRYSPGELPVVVFTSSREPSDVARAYAAGANSYVVKPLVHEEYVEVVGLVARYWLEVNECQRVEERGHA